MMIEVGLDYAGRDYAPIQLPIASGESTTEVMYCPWHRDLFIQLDTHGLESGESITFTVEGSLTGSADDFDNLSATGATIERTVNGTKLVTFDGAVPPYVRVSVASVEAEDSIAGYSIYAAFGVMS